ncbi:ankyrin repeat-containing domain protein [Chaetomium sp. MPI-SDFR-AT-0129]|nr:ankyrin repeat-containing domain protein [Chaetomium sp. MPI-SDFR-AT-0129]
MVVSRPVSLKVLLVRGLTWFDAVSGLTEASNASMCLGARLEPRKSSTSKQGFAFRLHRSDTTPDVTVNPINRILTYELRGFLGHLNLVQAEQIRKANDLEAQLKAESQKRASEQAELDNIRREIARLQERERQLERKLPDGSRLESQLTPKLERTKEDLHLTHVDISCATELLRDRSNPTHGLNAIQPGQYETLFGLAIKWSHERLARSLLELTDRYVLTKQPSILHDAIRRGNERMVKLLLDHGAPIHGVDGHRNNSLHLAASLGSPEITNHLLKKGASTYALNDVGHRPVSIALICGHDELLPLLQVAQPPPPVVVTKRSPWPGMKSRLSLR